MKSSIRILTLDFKNKDVPGDENVELRFTSITAHFDYRLTSITAHSDYRSLPITAHSDYRSLRLPLTLVET